MSRDTPIGKDLELAADLLRKDGLVAIPTETVYGLAGNAFSEKAVTGIFKAKDRPFFDPLICHIGRMNQVELLADQVPELAWKLAQTFWPGPLTLVLPKTNRVPYLVTSGNETVGIRMPRHELSLQLLQQLDFPLAAPSANPFGYVSPTTPEHVKAQLNGKIDYILDGGPCQVGLESTIIGFEEQVPVVLRLGGLSLENIEAITGKVNIRINQHSNPNAPGQLDSHYAPGTPLRWLEQAPYPIPENTGYLGFNEYHPDIPKHLQILLSPGGNLDEAGTALFAAMRALDNMNLGMILVSRFPEYGLGKAINDRLNRAVIKR